MKNVQVIDGADNCTYDIYEATDDEFETIFPGETDIEFIEDFIWRVGEARAGEIADAMWTRRADKKQVTGIHGTLFYELHGKSVYYPTKREAEARALGRIAGCRVSPVAEGQALAGQPPSQSVTRWVRGYDKMTETVAVEYLLSEKWDLKRLQALFGVPANDPMFDSFPIGADEAAILSEVVSGALALDTHDFFLARSPDSKASTLRSRMTRIVGGVKVSE